MRTRLAWLVSGLALLAGPAAAQRGRPAPAAAPAANAVDPALYAGLKFRQMGPWRGGRSTAVAGHASQPFQFLFGGTGGGVFKTDDAGTTWTNISDGFFGGSIGAIDIADSDPNVIVVGTGSADIRGNTSPGRGVYRSTDAGKTWAFIGLKETQQIARVVIHPNNPDLFFVAALGHPFGKNKERGIFRTKDGGATWQHVLALNDSTGASDLAMDPTNPRILYAGMWRGERKPWTLLSGAREGGVYKSTDGGDTWKRLTTGLPTGLIGKVGVTVSAANPNRVWALLEAEPDGGLYRSDDAGASWTRVNSSNNIRQRAWYYTHVMADPQNDNTVYVLNTSIYRSVDGGKTLTNIPVPHGDTHDLWINPTNPKIMIIGDDGGAQVTINGGKSWSTYNNQPTAEFYDVIVDNGFPYRIYTSQQDNTSISIPAWSSTNTLHPVSEWRYASGCETGPVALHPDKPEVIWGGCYGGAINRWDTTTDLRQNVIAYPQLQLGQAAKDLKYRFQWVAPILVSKHDANVVYHGAQKVLRTSDAGRTWTEISPDLTTNDKSTQEAAGGPINHDVTGVEIFNTIFALAESPRDAKELWAGSDDGRLHVTRDGGTTWTEITPPGLPKFATVNRIDLSVHKPGRAYVAIQRYRMDDFAPYAYRTDDWGKTWTRMTDGSNGIPADHFVRVVREDKTREGLLYAGTEFGLYVSFDNGRRWQPLQNNLPIVPVSDLAVHRNDLVVSTQGRSLWLLDDLTPLQQLMAGAPSAKAHLFEPRATERIGATNIGGADSPDLAPDARAEGVILTYWLADSASAVTIDITDAQGRLVRRLSSDSAAARRSQTSRLKTGKGSHRTAWDITYAGPTLEPGVVVWGYTGGVKAPPGTYTATFSANGVTQTQTIRVLPDPRLSIAQADYDAQLAASLAVRDSMDAVHEALRTLRGLAAQATKAVELAATLGTDAQLKGAADTLTQSMTGVEVELTQVKSQSGQDPIRHAGKIDNQLAELYGFLTGANGYIGGGAEGRPKRSATERAADLNREWAIQRLRYEKILREDIPAFNARAQKAGVGPLVVPSKKPKIAS
ncbi:MAG: glycosyl hydrolase [Gemmatimonadaceae bacterium]|nr:glycosyl hydrolase [Gemmatimonadaceae bacterium]